MKQAGKRLTSLLLALVMMVSLFPFGILKVKADDYSKLQPSDTDAQLIGYGYNVTSGKPLTKKNLEFYKPILDRSNPELYNNTFVADHSGSQNKSFTTESALEMAEQVASVFNLGINAKVSIVNVDIGTAFNKSETVSHAAKERYEYFYNQIDRKSMIIQLSTSQLRQYLSNDFKNDLYSIGDKESAKAVLTKYGTHLMTGYLLGGRLEITNYIVTSEKSKDFNSVKQLSASVGAAVSAGGLEASGSFEELHASHVASSTTKLTYNCSSVGGEAVTGMSIDQLFKYSDSYLNGKGQYVYNGWVQAINEGYLLDVIGLANGAQAIPVWELVYPESKNNKIKNFLLEAYIEMCDGKYDTYCEQYAPLYRDIEDTEQEGEAGGKAKIDGYYQAVTNNNGKVTINQITLADGVIKANVNKNSEIFMVTSEDTIAPENKRWKVTGDGASYVTITDEVNGVFKISADAVSGKSFKVQLYTGENEVVGGGITFTIINTKFSGGEGTASNPYIISTKNDLITLATENAENWTGKYYIQTDNIDWGRNEVPLVLTIGNGNKAFNSTYDGNNYMISNAGASECGRENVGLFGIIGTSGTVKNLTIHYARYNLGDDETATAKTVYAGALAGRNQGTIENCRVTNSRLYVKYTNTTTKDSVSEYPLYVGGLVGWNSGTIRTSGVTNTTTQVSIDLQDDERQLATASVGGLVGKTTGGAIENCYTRYDDSAYITAYIHSKEKDDTVGHAYIGGLAGYAEKTTISYCVIDNPATGNMKSFIDNCDDSAGDYKEEKYAGTLFGKVNSEEASKPTVSNVLSDKKTTVTDTAVYADIKECSGCGTVFTQEQVIHRTDVKYSDVLSTFGNVEEWAQGANDIPLAQDHTFSSTAPLSITGQNKEFYYGYELNPNGISVELVKSNGNTVPVTHYQINKGGYNKNAIGTYTVTISAGGYKSTYGASVVACDIIDYLVSDNDPTVLIEGTEYKPSERVITQKIVLSNGQTIPLDLNNKKNYVKYPASAPSFTPDGIISNGENLIKVTYGSFAKEYIVNGVEKKVVSYEITNGPTKKLYTEGQTFSTVGMVVTANYNDGTKGVTVNNSELEIIGGKISEGENQIRISYSNYSDIKTITVTGVVGMKIDKAPTKTTYYVDDTVDLTGIELSYTTDGENYIPLSVNSCTILNSVVKSVGENQVIIKYGESEAVFTVNGVARPNFTIRFVDKDGSLIEEKKYPLGSAVVAPQAPEVLGYTFKGWDKQLQIVEADATYQAVYDKNQYSVQFIGYNGVLISQSAYEYGQMVTAPKAPEVVGYTFKGWDKELAIVTENTVYTAVYDKDIYTVIFKGFDNQLLTQATYEYGAIVTTPQNIPVIEGYTFKGWDKDVGTVTENTTYTAVYEKNKYSVAFKGFEGALISQAVYEYGDAITSPQAPEVLGYTFKGWDKELTRVTGDTVYTAIYQKNVYSVTFRGFAGALLSQSSYEYGSIVTTPQNIPIIEGYTFKGWDKEIELVTGDTVYTAIYEANGTGGGDGGDDTPVDNVLLIADVDGDGKVTQKDAVLLLRYIHFPTKYDLKATGDVDGDGKITTDDAIYLSNYVFEPSKYPIG